MPFLYGSYSLYAIFCMVSILFGVYQYVRAVSLRGIEGGFSTGTMIMDFTSCSFTHALSSLLMSYMSLSSSTGGEGTVHLVEFHV